MMPILTITTGTTLISMRRKMVRYIVMKSTHTMMTRPTATAMTTMRIPTRSMITICIPTAMVMNILKIAPLPICMNTATIFFMHTITPTILNIQVLYIKCSVIL